MALHAVSSAALAAGALVAAYPPLDTTTAKYRIEQSLQQELDATGVGGPKQSVDASTTTFITVTLVDTTGGRAMTIVVDSMAADGGSPIPPAALDSARGATYHGLVSPTGSISNFKPAQPSVASAQLEAVLGRFYPRMKAGVEVGDGWSDTTETTSTITGGTVKTRTLTTYEAAGNEVRDGTRSLRINAAFKASVAGTQETPGGTADIQGTGTGSGTYYIGADGRYLGGTTTQTSSLSVAGAFAPAPIPVSIKQTTTITPLTTVNSSR